MSFSLYIARRYTISFSKSTAVNIITGIATLGILVSTAALFVIMSVFSGLRDFSLSFASATDPDLKITAITGKSFTFSAGQKQQLAKVQGIAAYSAIAEERVLFYFQGKEQVAYLKGVDSLYTTVTAMDSKKTLLGGQWLEMESGDAVVGAGTYNKLGLGLFDLNRPLEVYVPKAGEGAINSEEEGFNKEELMVTGVYSINEDIDSKYVFCSIDLAQKLLDRSEREYTTADTLLVIGTGAVGALAYTFSDTFWFS
ncbi:MAG: ABC transporter permease, partial [Sphingobacteriales bacterium]